MKIKILSTFVILGAGIFWWLFPHHATEAISQSVATNRQSISATPQQIPPPAQQQTQSQTNLPETPPSSAQEFVNKTMADPQYEWKMPINFWGRIVDENNNAVVAANVHFSWTDLSPNGTSEVDVQSDSNGFFSLTGKRGKRLSVDVSKKGYYGTSSSACSFEYANPADGLFKPDPMKPVVFRLKTGGKIEPLKVHSVRFDVAEDDSLSGFDPVRCKIDPKGTLKFNLLMQQPDENRRADARLRITIQDGGVQMAEDEFPFLAPENNYRSSIDIEVPKETTQRVFQCYFFYGNPRQYGRLQIEVPTYSRSGSPTLSFTYWLNPSGSRILEADPSKFIRPVPNYYLQANTPSIDELP